MISGVVLAGGGSSRAGTDKSMLTLGADPLITWVTAAFTDFDELIISISSESQETKYGMFIDTPHRFVLDVERGRGPLAGLLSAVGEAEGDLVAVAPCDTPFITGELYRILVDRAEGRPGAAPRINDNWEPLIAVYERVPLQKILEKLLKADERRLSLLCTELDIQPVSEKEFLDAGLETEMMMNINAPEDLENAVKYMASRYG